MSTEYTVIDTRTPEGWQSWYQQNVKISDSGVELSREDSPTYVSPKYIETDDICAIDVDTDRCNLLYLLGGDGELYRSDPSQTSFNRLPCWEEDDRHSPTGFCITKETIYVIGSYSKSDDEGDTREKAQKETTAGQDSQQTSQTDEMDNCEADNDEYNRGYVEVISAHLWQTRWIIDTFDEEKPFENPLRVVTGQSSREVFVLDSGHGDGQGFVVGVGEDKTTRLVASKLHRPVDLTVDDRGDLYILDINEQGYSVLKRYATAAHTTSSDDRATKDEDDESSEMPETSGQLCLLDDAASLEAIQEGVLVIGLAPKATSEKTLLRYDVNRGRFERLTGFKKSCIRLRRGHKRGADSKELYAISGDSNEVWLLNAAYAIQRWKDTYAGRLTKQFDTGTIVPEWYQISLKLKNEPPETQVRLFYATSTEEWSAGDDISWNEVHESNQSEALVPSEGNRFLWVRVDIAGSQYASPIVESLRVSYSHDSYLRYLPSIFVEDKASAEFLQRFLMIFESSFAEIDDEIAALTRYFDPRSVPGDSVSWLGSWLAVAEDDSWPEKAKRELIKEAPYLFKRRGTRRGLLKLLDIYLRGVPVTLTPTINDPGLEESDSNTDNQRSMVGTSGFDCRGQMEAKDRDCTSESNHGHFVSLLEYSDISEETTNEAVAPFRRLLSCPQEFAVLLGPTISNDTRATVERIIDSEKPVHTTSRVVSLQKYGRVGDHMYLGVNSRLESQDFVVDESNLGKDSKLTERERGGQLGVKSRLDEDVDLS
ncbi:phage tail protein [Haladaptatus sp. NG-SE-30]